MRVMMYRTYDRGTHILAVAVLESPLLRKLLTWVPGGVKKGESGAPQGAK